MYSGDIRRSLQITKRAVELCRDEHFSHGKSLPDTKGQRKRVINKDGLTYCTMSDVLEAFEQLFQSHSVKVLRALSANEALVLLSLYTCLTSSKSEKVLMDKVFDQSNYFLK